MKKSPPKNNQDHQKKTKPAKEKGLTKEPKRIRSIFIKIGLIMLPLILGLMAVMMLLTYNIAYENSMNTSKETIRDTANAAVPFFEAYNLYDSQETIQSDDMVSKVCDMFNITYLFALSIDPEDDSETYLAIGFGENAS